MTWLPDWFTGYDAANADAAARADATRAGLDTADYNAGKFGELELARRQDTYGVDKDAQRQEIQDTFNQSVIDNAVAMSDGVNKTLSFTIGKIFSAIPLSVWLLAAVVLFFWMGGATLLKGRLAKR